MVESLGQAVYLADAIRDYKKDVGAAYNPLVSFTGGKSATLPYELRHEVLKHVGRRLHRGRRIATGVASQLKKSWNAIQRVEFYFCWGNRSFKRYPLCQPSPNGSN